MSTSRPPAGPRGAAGVAAESAAADYLRQRGWAVLGRNLRVGRDEVDILALEPGSPSRLVVVEVRGRSRPGFGAAIESVDAAKVARLYRAVSLLRRTGHPALPAGNPDGAAWRVDLLTLTRGQDAVWRVDRHVRGLRPPHV